MSEEKLKDIIKEAFDFVNRPWGFECENEQCNKQKLKNKKELMKILLKGME